MPKWERQTLSIRSIAHPVQALSPDVRNETVIECFNDMPEVSALAVLDRGKPIGLISRNRAFLAFAREFGRAVYAHRPVTTLMHRHPLIVPAESSVDELRVLVADEAPDALEDGFIITEKQKYLGIGNALGILQLGIRQAELGHAELTDAKNRAEQASNAKTKFLANMSHELRTPLNAIIGFSELIANETLGPDARDTYCEYARDINDSGRLLLDIVNDLLDMAKIESGQNDLEIRSMDLRGPLQSALKMLSERAQTKGILLRLDTPSMPVMIRADKRSVRQIAINILSNAIKFTASGGAVTVGINMTRDTVSFYVEDTGIGIPKDKLKEVLEPFFQVASELTREEQGTGLGLSIVRSMARMQGGDVQIESEEGQGTTVNVSFPCIECEACNESVL